MMNNDVGEAGCTRAIRGSAARTVEDGAGSSTRRPTPACSVRCVEGTPGGLVALPLEAGFRTLWLGCAEAAAPKAMHRIEKVQISGFLMTSKP